MRVRILAFSLLSCVTLGTLLDLSELHFPHLKYRDIRKAVISRAAKIRNNVHQMLIVARRSVNKWLAIT